MNKVNKVIVIVGAVAAGIAAICGIICGKYIYDASPVRIKLETDRI